MGLTSIPPWKIFQCLSSASSLSSEVCHWVSVRLWDIWDICDLTMAIFKQIKCKLLKIHLLLQFVCTWCKCNSLLLQKTIKSVTIAYEDNGQFVWFIQCLLLALIVMYILYVHFVDMKIKIMTFRTSNN